MAEDSIVLTLTSIKDRLPGLNLYKHLYSKGTGLDELMETAIVKAYYTFIQFCIAATKFYRSSGFRR